MIFDSESRVSLVSLRCTYVFGKVTGGRPELNPKIYWTSPSPAARRGAAGIKTPASVGILSGDRKFTTARSLILFFFPGTIRTVICSPAHACCKPRLCLMLMNLNLRPVAVHARASSSTRDYELALKLYFSLSDCSIADEFSGACATLIVV